MRGVIYYAVCDPRYVKLAVRSAASLKRHMPSMHVTLFTDLVGCEFVKSPSLDSVRYIPRQPCDLARFNKPLVLLASPYDSFLYIDADTRICSDISDMFECVEDDRVDIAAVLTFTKTARYREFNEVFASEGIPGLFPFYSAAMLVIQRNARTTAFLEEWEDHYVQMVAERMRYTPDEPSMRVALHRCSDVRMMPLNREYAVDRHALLTDKAKIIHWKGGVRELTLIEKDINRRVDEVRFVCHGRDLRIRI